MWQGFGSGVGRLQVWPLWEEVMDWPVSDTAVPDRSAMDTTT